MTLREQIKAILATVGQFATAGGNTRQAIEHAKTSLSRALVVK